MGPRASESMIQRDDSGSRANFGERATSHVSQAKVTDAIDTDFETWLIVREMTVLIFYRQPRSKKQHEKSTDVPRENEGVENKKLERPNQGYGPKEFQSLPSPRSFSNLRAVALNSCKYLSNVQLTGARVYERVEKEETGKKGDEGRKGKERASRRKKILEIGKPFMVFFSSESFFPISSKLFFPRKSRVYLTDVFRRGGAAPRSKLRPIPVPKRLLSLRKAGI